MSEQYPGGFITKSPVAVTSSAASGVWTMSQYMQYAKAGPWPGLFPSDPYFTNVAALLHMDGTNGGTSFPDNSLPGLYETPTNATTSTTQIKFGTASGYFNGSAKLQSGTSGTTQFNFGTGDFTVEFWIYKPSFSDHEGIFYSGSNPSVNTELAIYSSLSGSNSVNAFVSLGGSSVGIQGLSINTWYHIAFVRQGGVLYAYKNGVLVNSEANSGNVTGTDYSLIGYGNGVYGINYLTGYLDDFRVTKGIARYTGNFTVPTAAYPNTGPATPVDPFFSNVSLLLHMDGANGGTTFTDSSSNALTMTASSVTTSTTQIKWGTASGSFGSGTLTAPSNTVLNIASGADFTIEFWVYPTATTNQRIVAVGSSNVVNTDSGGYLYITYAANGGGYCNTPASFLTANTWQHIAICRSGGTNYIFKNGVSASLTVSGTVSGALSLSGLVIGNLGAYYLNGYLDDFRFTNGTARYTASFTPPQLPFPNTATATTTYATWNNSDKGSAVTLSNNYLLAYVNGYTGVRATKAISSGKWYWEVSGTAGSNDPYPGVGIANSSASLSTYGGQDNNSGVYYASASGGYWYKNNVVTSITGIGPMLGQTLAIALDYDAGTIQFYRNNVLLDVRSHGITGALYPYLTQEHFVTSDWYCSTNFGQNPLKYTPPNGTFWNAADKNAAVTLSNNNMNYSTTATANTQRANTSKSSGQWYFEYTALNSSGYVGISNSTDANSVTYGSTANSKVYSYLGGVYVSGSYAAYGASWTTNDVIGIAVDLTAGTLTFYKNGVSQGVATTGLTGSWYPSTGARGDTPNGQLNTGVSAFKYTPPSGYSAWDSTTYAAGVY